MAAGRRLVAALVLAALGVGFAYPADGGRDQRDERTQWALTQIGAPEAWARTTGAGVRIGIVDTGVDLTNADVAGQVVAATTCLGTAGDAARCSGSGLDDDGHGTRVAAIAAAVRRDGPGARSRIAGTAPDAELVVAKSVSGAGVAAVADVVAGIKWSVDHGARVVNLSLDSPDWTFAGLRPADIVAGLDYAWTRGAIPVLSAGSPARLGAGFGSRSDKRLNAVVVAATAADGRMAPTSPPTGDARLAVLAPGGDGGSTSAAAAYVSGALALLLAEGYNPLGAVERLLSSADGTVMCGQSSPDCWGRIDVAAATAGPVRPSSR